MNDIKFQDVSDPLFQAKFWRQVKNTGLCWEWTGAKSRFGYGIVTVAGIHVRAHRVSYVMAYGGIATDKIACHTCDNPSCVNPLHVYEGTDKDNISDQIARGRRGYGHSGPRLIDRPFTNEEIESIRIGYASGVSASALAKKHQVGRTTVQRIVQGTTYCDAPGPITVPGKKGRRSFSTWVQE